MARVILKFRQQALKEFPVVKDELIIGRSPASDIHIDSLAVSNSHARIVREGERFFVEDLGSLNGTFLGGRRIQREELTGPAELKVGKHTLEFVPEEETEAEKKEEGPEGESVSPTLDLSIFDKTMVLQTAEHRAMTGAGPAPVPPPRGALGVLRVVKGSAEKEEYELRGWLATIGRDSTANIRIKGFFAPGIAALLQRTEDAYYLSPPGKGRKPKLNGMPVAERTMLREGDVVEAGGVRMVFFLRQREEEQGD